MSGRLAAMLGTHEMSMKREQMQMYHDKVTCCTWRDVHGSLVAFIGRLFVASLDMSGCFVLVLLPCPAYPHCLRPAIGQVSLCSVLFEHELEAVDDWMFMYIKTTGLTSTTEQHTVAAASNLLRDPSSAAFMGSLPPSKTMIG